MKKKPNIFISYSHQDEKWKDWLRRHLDVEVKQNRLEVWDDRKIRTGLEYHPEIDKAIMEADIAILLISSHFLTSDFILKQEITHILEEKKRRGLILYPLIISFCNWENINWIEPIQGVTKNNQPLEGRADSQINQEFTSLIKKLYDTYSLKCSEKKIAQPLSEGYANSKSKEKIFTIFQQSNLDENSYMVTIYIQDEDEFNSEQINFNFNNIYDAKEQEHFISLLDSEFEGNVTVHFIIPPELFLVNFKQWKDKKGELVKRYHILLHNKENFDSKPRRHKNMIRNWEEIYDKIKNRHIRDTLIDADSGKKFDMRDDKIGVCFKNKIENVRNIIDSVDIVKVGMWQYPKGDIKRYKNWMRCEEMYLKSLENRSRECDYLALLWDDMSLFQELKKRI